MDPYIDEMSDFGKFIVSNPYVGIDYSPILDISTPRPKYYKYLQPKTDKLKQKRNSLCNCGSGKKFKKCCYGNL